MAKGSDWSTAELAAVTEAYLQMLRLEELGEPYNKAAVRRMLLGGPLAGRTNTEQRMQNVSHVLQLMKRRWIDGYKPLSNVGRRTEERIRKLISDFSDPSSPPMPVRPPVAPTNPDRILPPTGYWMFVCNRDIWNGEAYLRDGGNTLLYKVGDHNRTEVQAGDLGLLRLSMQRRVPRKPRAVYALVVVLEQPTMRSDPDERYYTDAMDARNEAWRARLQILVNLVDAPIEVEKLPGEEDFNRLKRALRTPTIPISRHAFSIIFNQSGAAAPQISDIRNAASTSGIQILEQKAANADPKTKERISKYIERGPVGEQVKALRGHKCQVCEAMDRDPVSFRRKDGSPYSEAHHVVPVAMLVSGSLRAENIMVLCPNHHRQAHYGDFEVSNDLPDRWAVLVDGRHCEISKPRSDEILLSP